MPQCHHRLYRNAPHAQLEGSACGLDARAGEVTNVLGPMYVLETCDLVTVHGMIRVMSSRHGSASNNTNGQREEYRGSKAALIMFIRNFATRLSGDCRTMVRMDPGWVRPEMGGPDARHGIEHSVPNIGSTQLATQRKPGLRYLDWAGSLIAATQHR